MTDSPIGSFQELIDAFGGCCEEEVAEFIEETADLAYGRQISVRDFGPEVLELLIDTIGVEISYPTTTDELIEVANQIEGDLSYRDVEPTFRVIPGSADSGVILHVPHASRLIPDDLREDFLLDDDELKRELDAMTDAFTDVIAQQVAQLTGVRPWIFVNEMSRLVIDPERFPDYREEMNAIGMGVAYTCTSGGAELRSSAARAHEHLVDRYFWPYASGFSDLVHALRMRGKNVTIIDLHSFPLVALPYELHADGPRPEICLGTDQFHTPTWLLDAAKSAFNGFDVGTDSPFSGCYVPTSHYCKDDGVRAIMVEIRRDLYMDESYQLVEPAIAPIVEALAQLVMHIDLDVTVTCEGMSPYTCAFVAEETE